MFHWICPECGREILPKLKQCPSCDPQSEPAVNAPTPLGDVAAAAVNVPRETTAAPTADVPAPATAPAASINLALTLDEIATPVEPAVAAGKAELQPAATLVPIPAIDASKTIERLDPVERPAPVEPRTTRAPVEAAAEPRTAGRSESVAETPVESVAEAPHAVGTEGALAPPPAPAVIATASIASKPISQVNQDDVITEEIILDPPALAQLAAAVGVSEPRSVDPESPSPGSGSPARSREHATEDATEASQTTPASASERAASVSRTTRPPQLTYEPVESGYAQATPPALVTDVGPLVLLAPPDAALAPPGNAAIPAPPDLVAPPKLTITGLAEPGEPSAERPPSGSWLQLAPLQNYSAGVTRAIQPVPPAPKITPDSGPSLTLPSPALPPDLARFQNANLVTVIGDASRAGKSRMPGWVISFLVTLALLAIGAGVVFYFFPVSHSNAETRPAGEERHTVASQVPTQPASHPLAQYVEVTGFRIVVDFDKKSEIHYLIVNHSGADLSDVTVYVTLRTASAKLGQPPLCRFSFRAPSLGPFESKEMTSSIEKLSRSITLPEWQDLRPEVQIAQ